MPTVNTQQAFLQIDTQFCPAPAAAGEAQAEAPCFGHIHLKLTIQHTALNATELDCLLLNLHTLECHPQTTSCIQLAYRTLAQGSILPEQFPGQRHLAIPACMLRRIAMIPILHPANEHPPPVRRFQRLGCVKVQATVQRGVRLLYKGGAGALPAADQCCRIVAAVITVVCGLAHKLGGNNHDRAAFQLKQVRAFPHAAQTAIVLRKDLHKFPTRVRVERRSITVEQQPSVAIFPPSAQQHIQDSISGKQEGVPEISAGISLRLLFTGQHRGRRLGIVPSIAHSHALLLDLSVVLRHNAGVKQQLFALPFHCSTGKTAFFIKGRIRSQRAGLVVPVKEIGGHGMSPMHGAPAVGIGVILIEQMVLSLVAGPAVGVIAPAHRGYRMKYRALFQRSAVVRLILASPAKSISLLHCFSP